MWPRPALSGTRFMDHHTTEAPKELQINVCSVVKVEDVCVVSSPVRMKAAAVIVNPHILTDTVSTSWTEQLVVNDFGRPPTNKRAA